jgi:hypothetical protein
MTERPARRFATSDVIPAIGSQRRAALLLTALAASYAAALACAALPQAPAAAAVLAVVACAEIAAARGEPAVPWAMRFVGMTDVARGLLRGLVVVLLAARTADGSVTIAAALAVAAIAAATTALSAAQAVVAYLRRPVIRQRNLPMPADLLPSSPLAAPLASGVTTALEVVAGAIVAAGPRIGDAPTIGVLAALAAAPTAAVTVTVGQAARRGLRGTRQRIVTATEKALAEIAPEVLVYFGSTAEWTYQLDMWLRPVEQLSRRCLLIVRDPDVLARLAPSPLPAIAVSSANVLMDLPIPSARVALYVGNTANNLHLLRRPQLVSAFIGHGESDKSVSVNPYLRVYRELWVAGDAGRERILGAGLGVAPEAIIEIGRPQLPNLARRPAGPRLTVTYAPTWEGYGESDHDSSLSPVGPALIRRLLARPDVRVMYRPHPTAGMRDPAVRAAHRQIVRALGDAGARNGLVDDAHCILVPPCAGLYETFDATDVLIADISSVITDFLAADRPYAVVNTAGLSPAKLRERAPSTAGGFVLDVDLHQLDDLLTAARGTDPTAAARRATAHHLLGPRPADPAEPFRRAVERLCAPKAASPKR